MIRNMNKLFFILTILFLTSCFDNNFTEMKKALRSVDNCRYEYQTYHPKYPSKTCSRVVNRKCLVNKFCKKNKTCIENAKLAYPPYLTKNDEEYCSCLVQAEKGERDFKECDTIK